MLTFLMENMVLNAMADLLSQKNWVGSSCACNNSVKILLIHTVWWVVAITATDSTSTDDKVTMGCFFDAQAIAPDPK